MLYIALIGALGLAAVPFLPKSFTGRMDTIQGYQADASAVSRLAVWGWTLEYVQDHPLGGGFEAYRQNSLLLKTVATQDGGNMQVVDSKLQEDKGRAYHSAYFEMLGEQGYPGLLMFLLIHAIGLVRMEVLRRRHWKAEDKDGWIAPLATSLQHAQIIYLVGALFVGIAFQTFIYMLLAVQISLDSYLKLRDRRPRTLAPRALAPEPAQA
jgi:O-antigen ligase